MRRIIALVVLLSSSACSKAEHVEPAPELQVARSANSPTPPPTSEAPAAKPLPVLGDPYGLLSRPPEAPAKRTGSLPIGRLDPGALAASPSQRESSAPAPERDPRAVDRANAEPTPRRPQQSFDAEVHDMSAAEVMREVNRGRGLPQVLFLYASYCQYCRSAMSPFLALSQHYRERGVRFTAASVDTNRDAFAAYAPSLGGQFPAWWVLPDTGMRRELANLGVTLKESGTFGFPLFAVLDARQRVVSQGASVERMAHSLDKLLAN